jgi:ribosomal protein S18 acetylase RimI-like enzyme
MHQSYYKRYRMEISLRGWSRQTAALPAGYTIQAWNADLVELHAEAKYRSFRGELDSLVFPCLGDPEGCRRLMSEICRREGFLPEATWLAVHNGEDGMPQCCGTVQGIHDGKGVGAIQNLGVAPEHRGRGLGTYLLTLALTGFSRAGLRRAFLEVTAKNADAVRLYRRCGFRHAKTVYKPVEMPCPS